MKMKYLISILLLTTIIGCSEGADFDKDTTQKEIEAVFDEFYAKYEGEDITFTDYYSDDVIRLAPSGNYTEGVEEFREGWEQTISDDSFELLGFGEPRFIISKEQVVSFNEFDELFISPESGDTTRYTGTWIAVWQQQSDDQWKIKMTTWHTN